MGSTETTCRTHLRPFSPLLHLPDSMTTHQPFDAATAALPAFPRKAACILGDPLRS